ncbi:hypothetical protein [Pseudoponticoccus marisrubri]|uniref:NADH dehydrogenase n=1 Tax=Pseudoponticoccus marisrubri TaxID=1685382 RepID=A0A0W7WEM7_9RHOB|nr:hypothetical protein [Pseudoponticoccus marisrubri]KUF09088.1 hypothetical protein AVJ23_19375 [Pseudoponticoccus marisrubri]
MKKTLAALLVLTALAGCDEQFLETIPGTEEYERRQAQIASWEGAVASVGCKLVSEAQYLPVELQSGLTREQVTGILSEKVAANEAVARPEGGYDYVAGPCTPAPQPVPAETTTG